jgi:hypothetical protein
VNMLRRSGRSAPILSVAMAMAIAMAIASGCGGDSSSSGETTSAPKSTTTTSNSDTKVYPIGQQLYAGFFGVRVHRFIDPYEPVGAEPQPGAGKRFVAIDEAGDKLEIKGFGHGTTPLDGKLQADQTKRSQVVFEAPQGAKHLMLKFVGALTGHNTLNIRLS